MKLGKTANCFVSRFYSLYRRNGGFGMNELLGIAAALILAAFVIIPGLRDFAEVVMLKLGTWWSGSVMSNVFPTT